MTAWNQIAESAMPSSSVKNVKEKEEKEYGNSNMLANSFDLYGMFGNDI